MSNNRKFVADNIDSDYCLKWSHEATFLLLQLRFAMMEDFCRGEVKKKFLWETIANKVNEVSPLLLDASKCDNKYRNLLNEYRIQKKKNAYKRDENKWIFYDYIDEHVGENSTIYLHPNTLGSSLQVDAYCNESVDEDYEPVRTTFQSRKRDTTTTIKEVLEKKIKLNHTKDELEHEQQQIHWSELQTIENDKVKLLSSISQSIQTLLTKVSEDNVNNLMTEKIRSDCFKYEERQMEREKRWNERKELMERKNQILTKMSNNLIKLAEKIK